VRWTCDHPGTTRADYLDHMAELVRRHGWALQFVEPDRDRPPYTYTLGLTLYGLPELVVTGLPARRSAELLNGQAARVLVDGAPLPGSRLVLPNGAQAEVVELPQPDAHLFVAVDLFGAAALRARQLVRADDRGRWPWEIGHRAGRGGQPVLGPRSRDSCWAERCQEGGDGTIAEARAERSGRPSRVQAR
jgi:hypothetical protein